MAHTPTRGPATPSSGPRCSPILQCQWSKREGTSQQVCSARPVACQRKRTATEVAGVRGWAQAGWALTRMLQGCIMWQQLVAYMVLAQQLTADLRKLRFPWPFYLNIPQDPTQREQGLWFDCAKGHSSHRKKGVVNTGSCRKVGTRRGESGNKPQSVNGDDSPSCTGACHVRKPSRSG